MALTQSARPRLLFTPPALRPWRHVSWYVVIPWLLAILAVAAAPTAAYAEKIFVPQVMTNRDPVEGSGNLPAACALSSGETAVLAKMASMPEQRRPRLLCDPVLAKVARARAADMAARDYFGHTNPDGKGPNTLVMEAGFPLPDWYDHDRDANNVESIAAGFATPGEAWDAWMDSRGHRTHLLALDNFYAEQVMVGIGYATAPGTEFEHYWVVITAPDPAAATTVLAVP